MSVGTKGRTQTTKGVAESKLRVSSKMRHKDADPQALLTREAIKNHVEAGTCPWCGAGPFQVIAMHTSRAHGVGREELCVLAGMPKSTSITSADYHERASDSRKARGMPAGARAGFDEWLAKGRPYELSEPAKQAARDRVREIRMPGNSNLSDTQKAEAVERMREVRSAKTKERDSRIIEALSDESKAMSEIAAEFGVHVKTIRQTAKRLGVYRDGRSRPAAFTRLEKSE